MTLLTSLLLTVVIITVVRLVVADILVNLFDRVMGPDDRFILSKGHGCWVYYVLLRELGFNPLLEGHPHYDPSNGVFCHR